MGTDSDVHRRDLAHDYWKGLGLYETHEAGVKDGCPWMGA